MDFSGRALRARNRVRSVLAALLDEAISAVGVLRDHDERSALEAGLAFQRLADEVVVLVLGWDTHAALGLDLGVEAPCADAQRHALAWPGKELPGVLRDKDPGLADIF